MFDIGWTEMLVVAVVAIIVVGPKDLPGMLRTVGKSVKKIRGMAGDFQRQFDDALKEAELDGVKKSIDEVRSMNPLNQVKDSLNPLKDAVGDIQNDINSSNDDEVDYSSFDPGELFDESKSIKVAEPVKVDVEAALAKEKAKTSKSAAANKPKSPRKTAAKSKAKTVKTAAALKKVRAKKPVATKVAAKKPVGKPRKSAPKKAKSA